MINTINILKIIGQQAALNGLKAWAVGGFVRDYFLCKPTVDIDICFEGDYAPIIKFCKARYGAKVEAFTSFGTARLNLKNGLKLDFVRCRREVYPSPAALPIVTPATLQYDLYRRDFTCNAAALSLLQGEFFEIYDYYGAIAAIKTHHIAILHPASFVDDPARIYRALRFAGRFGWDIEPKTALQIKAAVKEELPLLLSRQRIRQELIKILQEQNPKPIFNLLKLYDAGKFIYPGLTWPMCATKVTNWQDRLLMLALKLGPAGAEFLEHLHLARVDYRAIFDTWVIHFNKQAPLKPLKAGQKKLLRLFTPKLAPSALKLCFLTVGDIQAAGFSGPAIKELQNKAAKLQWQGKIKSKAAALKLLKVRA